MIDLVVLVLAYLAYRLLTRGVPAADMPTGERQPVHYTPDNHQDVQSEARQVLSTVRAFTGDHLVPRVLGYLRKVDPYVMEELLLICFHERGFDVRGNASYSGDVGIDGRLYWRGQLFLVQSKRYGGHIDAQDMKAFGAKIREVSAAGGYFCHTGRTGRLAWVMAKRDGIRLVSGAKLIELVLGKTRSMDKQAA